MTQRRKMARLTRRQGKWQKEKKEKEEWTMVGGGEHLLAGGRPAVLAQDLWGFPRVDLSHS